MIPILRTGVLSAVLVAAVVLLAHFTAQGESSSLVSFIESLSSQSTGAVNHVGTWFPLGFAFAAGISSVFNPCGFVMLPAYLGIFVGQTAGHASSQHRMAALTHRVLRTSVMITAGFTLLFAAVGIVVSLGLRAVSAWFPWIGLSTGLLLMLIGVYVLQGGHVRAAGAQQLAARFMPHQGEKQGKGMFLFGLAYALVSLSCTLPIFLAVVGSSLSSETLPLAIGNFVLYALGMGSVIVVLSMVAGLFGQSIQGRMHRLSRHAARVSAFFALGAGVYTLYYWLISLGLFA